MTKATIVTDLMERYDLTAGAALLAVTSPDAVDDRLIAVATTLDDIQNASQVLYEVRDAAVKYVNVTGVDALNETPEGHALLVALRDSIEELGA